MKISKLLGVVCGAGLLFGPKVALADIAIGASGVTVNFTGFTGAGFSPTPSAAQLNAADWQVLGFSDGSALFDAGATSGDYARGSTLVTVTDTNLSGVYAFNTGTVGTPNPALGVKPNTDDFTPGTITARFTNSSGHQLIKLRLAYAVISRNSTARQSALTFAWSLDNATWTNQAALNYQTTAAADTTPAWVSTARTVDVTTSIATNGKLYLRWSGDDPGTGDVLGDEIGIDDIVISLLPSCGDAHNDGNPEECDDGNTSNADACLNTCVIAACGDGYVRTTGTTPEQCDGSVCCSSNCTRLTGTVCQGSGTCNNGVCVGGGQGGETGMAGDTGMAGEDGIGGEIGIGGEAGATQGGTGGRGGRGGRGGMAGTATGGAGTGGTAGGPASGNGGDAGGGNAAGTAGATAGTTATGGAGTGGTAGMATGGKSGGGGSSGKAGAAGGGAKPSGGSSGSSDDDSGCGCSVPRGSNHGSLALVAAGALATLMRRRRRNR